MTDEGFKDWAILELMGHRRLAGMVTEATIGGAAFIRIDIPHDVPRMAGVDELWSATQFYSPSGRPL